MALLMLTVLKMERFWLKENNKSKQQLVYGKDLS